MDLEHRVQMLEQELQILKGQIQATLLEIQEHLLTNAYPALRAEEPPRTAGSNPAPTASKIGAMSAGPNGAHAQVEVPDDEEESAVTMPVPPIVRRVTLEGTNPSESKSRVPTANSVNLRDAVLPVQEDYDTAEEPEPPRAPVRRVKGDHGLAEEPVPPVRKSSRRVEPSEEVEDDYNAEPPTRSNGNGQYHMNQNRNGDRDPVPEIDSQSDWQSGWLDEAPSDDPIRQQSVPGFWAPPFLEDLEEDGRVPVSSTSYSSAGSSAWEPSAYPPMGSPESEGSDIQTLNRLAQWLSGKIKKIGLKRTRKLIETNTRKGNLTPDIRDALVQLIALYDEDGSLNTQRLDNVLDGLGDLPDADTPLAPYPSGNLKKDQKLVLRLISGIRNAGDETTRRNSDG